MFLVPIVPDGNAYMSLYGYNMYSNAPALEREKIQMIKAKTWHVEIKK